MRALAVRLGLALLVLLAIVLAAGWAVTRTRGAAAVRRAELDLVRGLADSRTEPLDELSGPVAELGNTFLVSVVAVLAAIVFALLQRRWRPVLVLVVALLGEVAIFLTTAAVIDRRRPPVPHLDAQLPPTSSFPSGHTAAAVCLYGGIAVLVLAAVRAWWRWLVLVLALTIVVAVALARVYRGAHYPTDVLASLLFAVPWLLVVRRNLLAEASPRRPADRRGSTARRLPEQGVSRSGPSPFVRARASFPRRVERRGFGGDMSRAGRSMRRAGPVMSLCSVRRAGAAVLGTVLAVGGTALGAPASAAPPERAAVIVQLAPGSDAGAESRRAAANGGGSVRHVYTEVFRGFAGEFTTGALEGMRNNPRVLLIEADGVATVTASQPGATWGLDRIDQRALPITGSYDYSGTGAGVTAYIVDTGIAPHAVEFEDGLAPGTSVLADTHGTTDCNGHGTHVAGTVGGETHGVAKEVTLVPVRVLDCAGSGSWSGVIAGLDWVAGNHPAGRPAVANLSLGASRNNAVDAAVQRVIDDGVTVAVAAGNSNTNACNVSPARVAAALTTGATDAADRRASFSNYGSCLDLFAPGVSITAAWLGGTTHTISGTSMATPHVAGAAALRLERTPAASPATIAGELVMLSTKNIVSSAGPKSPNRLLHSPPS